MEKEVEVKFGSYRIELLKRQLFKMDKGICHICRKRIPYKNISLDHIIPVSVSGQGMVDDYWNLRISHRICNIKRGAGRLEGQMRLPLPLTFRVEGNNHNTPDWKEHIERLKKLKGLNSVEFWERYKKLQHMSLRKRHKTWRS